jgi:hypothetical protein
MYHAHADSLPYIDCVEPYTSLDTWQDLYMVTLFFKIALSLKRYIYDLSLPLFLAPA